MNCPTCGEPVEVYSADEGTHSYESVAMKRIKELEAFIDILSWSDNIPLALKIDAGKLLNKGE